MNKSDVYYNDGAGAPIIDVYAWDDVNRPGTRYEFQLNPHSGQWRATVSYDVFNFSERGL